jgi:hypothetical protein
VVEVDDDNGSLFRAKEFRQLRPKDWIRLIVAEGVGAGGCDRMARLGLWRSFWLALRDRIVSVIFDFAEGLLCKLGREMIGSK